MFEESWDSPAVLFASRTLISEKQWPSSNNIKASAPGKICSNTSSTSSRNARIQCPMCLRFFPARDFGRCIGAPTSEFPLLTTRKRKRTETRNAHETTLAPCHDCLDRLGEDEGATWGRCDNPKCWSRRGESSSLSSLHVSEADTMGMNTDGEYAENLNLSSAVIRPGWDGIDSFLREWVSNIIPRNHH